jgi:hypothetical protein
MQLLIFSYLEQGATCQVDRDRRLVKSSKTERGSNPKMRSQPKSEQKDQHDQIRRRGGANRDTANSIVSVAALFIAKKKQLTVDDHRSIADPSFIDPTF